MSNANPDAPIPPGQYRKISVEKGQQIPLGPTPNLRATQHDRYDTWIPAGLTPPYWSRNQMLYKVDFATPEARKAARKRAPYLLYPPAKPGVGLNPCKTAAPAGTTIVYVGQKDPCEASWRAPTVGFLAAQPRDPGALLVALSKNPRYGSSGYEAFRNIPAVLLSGIVPTDLRAALYQAARLIPGIQLLDDVVTIDGRRGRAIALENDGYRHDILISPVNGQYLGNRIVVTRNGPPSINGDAENAFIQNDNYSWSSVTTELTATPPPTK